MGKGVEVQFDKKRILRFDINAFADLEEKIGRGIASLFNEESVGISTLRLIVWAGLKHEEPSLGVNKTGALIQDYIDTGKSMLDLAQVVKDAVADSGLVSKESENPTEEVKDSAPLPTG